MSNPWGIGQGGNAPPADTPSDERPFSDYSYYIIGALSDGELFEEGADTREEADMLLSQIIQDPHVTDWVLYQRVLKAPSRAASSVASLQS